MLQAKLESEESLVEHLKTLEKGTIYQNPTKDDIQSLLQSEKCEAEKKTD